MSKINVDNNVKRLCRQQCPKAMSKSNVQLKCPKAMLKSNVENSAKAMSKTVLKQFRKQFQKAMLNVYSNVEICRIM